MHSKWREEKFLKRTVGDKMRLRFWNKHYKMYLVFMQLARCNWMHERRYQQSIPGNLAIIKNVSRLKVDIYILLLARVYSSPAAWAKDLSFDTCFRSTASFGNPHYLRKTSPHSIHTAWNSRILKFWVQKNTFATETSLKFCFVQRFRPVTFFSENSFSCKRRTTTPKEQLLWHPHHRFRQPLFQNIFAVCSSRMHSRQCLILRKQLLCPSAGPRY